MNMMAQYFTSVFLLPQTHKHSQTKKNTTQISLEQYFGKYVANTPQDNQNQGKSRKLTQPREA
jgi:hypothetical protein